MASFVVMLRVVRYASACDMKAFRSRLNQSIKLAGRTKRLGCLTKLTKDERELALFEPSSPVQVSSGVYSGLLESLHKTFGVVVVLALAEN